MCDRYCRFCSERVPGPCGTDERHPIYHPCPFCSHKDWFNHYARHPDDPFLLRRWKWLAAVRWHVRSLLFRTRMRWWKFKYRHPNPNPIGS